MSTDAEQSLADFFFPEDNGVLQAPETFSHWVERNHWAISMFEPSMHGAVGPEVELQRGELKRRVINLSSYNYMGLATHPEVVEAGRQALLEYGTGACGSPLLSGKMKLHVELEQRLSAFLGREDTMLFNSGFGGGMGSLAGILRKGDAAILDEKCHLCLIDGVKLSKAKLVFFRHNDPESLDEALKATEGRRRLVVVEGVYSMDGDTADLPKLLPVAEQHKVGMFIDEAHSILVFGENGRGVIEHYGVADRVGLQFATFSKSFASCGGFTSGSKRLIDYMRFYSNAYGFSCALPPVVVGGLLKALEVVSRDNSLREKLWTNTRYFHEQAHSLGLNLGHANSQVFPIIIGSNRQMLYEL
ncbi:MAG: aminotransferase class I/II-fold pyridoxal phosphate-dependent enzyme, partial [Nannocystaceae bacterium]